MRVKISYTVEEENVLKESAKLLNLGAEDLQQAISLFSAVQEELKASPDEPNVNIDKCRDMLKEFREALLTVDIRVSEVDEIVGAYADYKRSRSPASATIMSVPQDLIEPPASVRPAKEV